MWIGPLRNHSRADQRICVSLYGLPAYCEQCIFHWRVVPAAALRSLGNDPRAAAGGVTASGRVKSRLICADCGTWLYGNPRRGTEYPGMIRVLRGGTLDDTSWLRPMVHFWTRSKQPWITLPEGLALYETQPDG